MINTWDIYHARKAEQIPGTSHYRWVPDWELLPEMTPPFRRELACMKWRLNCEMTRRTVVVSTRKYRARRKR